MKTSKKNLGIESSKTSHDPQKAIFNFSSDVLTECEKSLHCKELNFAIPPDKLKYFNFLLPFELFSRDIQNLDVTGQKKQLLKARIKDRALISDCNWTRTHSQLVRIRLQTKSLWVRVQLQPLKNFRFRACFDQGVP